jgi:hypothetical protein
MVGADIATLKQCMTMSRSFPLIDKLELKTIERLTVKGYREIFFDQLNTIIEENPVPVISFAGLDKESNGTTSSSLSLPGRSSSSRGLSTSNDPDMLLEHTGNNTRYVLSIRNEFYKILNKMTKEYNGQDEIWNAVIQPGASNERMKEDCNTTIKLFVEAYKIFKEPQNEQILQHLTHPFDGASYHKYYDELSTTATNEINLIRVVKSAIDKYINKLNAPTDPISMTHSSRTSNDSARNLTEMLDGPSHWPSRKLAHSMKAINESVFLSAPFYYYNHTLQPQTRATVESYFKTDKVEAQVVYALVGITNVVYDSASEAYQITTSTNSHKTFVWIPKQEYGSTAGSALQKNAASLLEKKCQISNEHSRISTRTKTST